MVYTSTGQPTIYEKMRVTLFVSGFLAVMTREKDNIKSFMLQHLQKLMEDRVIQMGAHTVLPCHLAATVGTGQSDLGR